MRGKERLSRLVPKNHFCSFSLFREEPLINWTFTESVLFTAYDVYRSNNFWLDSVIRSGATLKEAMQDLGFPQSNTFVADTGIFEMEARKAGIARDLGIDVDIKLTNNQIFEAYKLSGADFFVSPDEIILPQDKPEEIEKKVETIKDNLLELLDIVPASQVIAVIQGIEKRVIVGLLDFYRENGIRYFAKGGVIPLYHYDSNLLEEVLKFTRKVTKGDWLHVFGLPHMRLLNYYLHELDYDSVDTSMLLYLSARRRYLKGSTPLPVRLASFKECGCIGCQNLETLKDSTRSSRFVINLYVHNLVTAAKVSHEPARRKTIQNTIDESSNKKYRVAIAQESQVLPEDFLDRGWMTAEEVMTSNKEEEEKRIIP